MYGKILIVLIGCIGVALSSPIGAPAIACTDMMPMHPNGTSLPLPSPYTYLLSRTPTGVDITITAGTGDIFRGFFIQARDASDVAVGTYSGASNAHTLDCSPGIANAYTHNDRNNKTSISFSWTAPSNPVPVTFYASTVRVVEQYYVKETIGAWSP